MYNIHCTCFKRRIALYIQNIRLYFSWITFGSIDRVNRDFPNRSSICRMLYTRVQMVCIAVVYSGCYLSESWAWIMCYLKKLSDCTIFNQTFSENQQHRRFEYSFAIIDARTEVAGVFLPPPGRSKNGNFPQKNENPKQIWGKNAKLPSPCNKNMK